MTRRISATLFTTLDGVIADPQNWSFPFWNDEIAKFKADELKRTDALLLGRVTYEAFAAAWPQRTDDAGFSDQFNSMPKYVVSSTLKEVSWTGSEVVRPADLLRLLAKLKGEDGGDIMAHGSASLVQSLIRDGQLDELRLLVYPTVLGRGKRLFEGTGEANLRLLSAERFATGVVALIYEPAPKLTTAVKAAATKAVLGAYKKKGKRGTERGAPAR